ncbi:SDR family oxidoreductase [Pseudonocardia ailaonensis]|uniref:SDR family oxidoreductase n=1 Tax=Pseudonocardia ailaonensis TaxID=367279 RepID=A0ABN2N9U1_9PSEU
MTGSSTGEGHLEGRCALVTGGTDGVGFDVAERLARRGAHVVITGRDAGRGAKALTRMGPLAGTVSFEQGDASDPAEITDLVERVRSSHGDAIDMLVSAGSGHNVGPTPFADLTFEQISQEIDTLLHARLFPVKAALPALRVRGGSVVMLTTDAARYPTPGESIIGAVGAAVILSTKALAREFSRWSIRVNSVAMTITSDTPSWDRAFAGETFQSRLFSKAVDRFPQGRAPTAGEVAAVAEHLATEMSQVTGQTISVNGGLSFGGW